MSDRAGESRDGGLWLDFERRSKPELHGSQYTGLNGLPVKRLRENQRKGRIDHSEIEVLRQQREDVPA